jgi:hypothetical protein
MAIRETQAGQQLGQGVNGAGPKANGPVLTDASKDAALRTITGTPVQSSDIVKSDSPIGAIETTEIPTAPAEINKQAAVALGASVIAQEDSPNTITKEEFNTLIDTHATALGLDAAKVTKAKSDAASATTPTTVGSILKTAGVDEALINQVLGASAN